jgi:type II secretion system protein H
VFFAMNRRLARQTGVTLIEMIVTIAILGVFAALVAPSFAGFLAKKRVEGVLAELVTDLQYARTEAVQRSRPVQVTFGANCYRIQALGSATATVSTTASCTASVPAAEAELKTVSLAATPAATLSTQGSLRAVLFDPVQGLASFTDTSGTAVASAQVDVSSSDGAHQLRVALSAVGRARTCSPNGSVPGYANGGC